MSQSLGISPLGDDCCPDNGLEPMLPVLEKIRGLVSPIAETETVSIASARGRVIGSDTTGRIALPSFDNSAVDGYGLPADAFNGPFPLSLKLGAIVTAGKASRAAGRGEAMRLLTGAMVPPGVLAIVAEERCEVDGCIVTFRDPIRKGANIRRRGEDVAAGSVVVKKGCVADARHLAILAASGCTAVEVRRRVRVGLLSTGNELCDSSVPLGPGMVHDVNRPMLSTMLAKPWADVADLGISADELAPLVSRLAEASPRFDIIVTSGGASGSDADHIGEAIRVAGGQAWQFRLAIKPGKPLIAGLLGKSVVLALPGNPVAALVSFMLFARPVLADLAGFVAPRLRGQPALCATTFTHSAGRTEFVPAGICGIDSVGRPIVDKLGKGGSARLQPLVHADGFAELSAADGDLPPGSRIIFHAFAGVTLF